MSMEKIHMPELWDAIPDTPDMCRDAVLHAVSTYREGRDVRRTYKVVFAVVLVLALLCGTVALAANGWNVLQFLQFPQDHMSKSLVEEVSASAQVDNCSIQIESVVTDGKYLAYDWTVENHDITKPVYIQVDSFTGNGIPLYTDGTDDFHQQWFPGMFNQGIMQDGNLTRLPENLPGDVVDVEMVIGVYTPVKPVCQMDLFDEEQIREKLNEGYYVIVEGEGLVLDDPESGLMVGYGSINDAEAMGFYREEMDISFTVNLLAGRAMCKPLTLPEVAMKDKIQVEYLTAYASPLQISCTIELFKDGMTRNEACELLEQGYFDLTDGRGATVEHTTLEGFGGIRERPDGAWCIYYDCSIANDEQLPEEVSMSFIMQNDQTITVPLKIK